MDTHTTTQMDNMLINGHKIPDHTISSYTLSPALKEQHKNTVTDRFWDGVHIGLQIGLMFGVLFWLAFVFIWF